MTNCPNCGAPIVASQCEYCGTMFPEYHSPSKARTLLELETEFIKHQMAVMQLYEDAIRAMRSYSENMR